MKITFKETPEQLELIAKMGSKNVVEAAQAQEIFAQLLSPTIGQVFNQADTTKMFFKELSFREDEDPTFPIEPFLDLTQDTLSVWSQGMPGGLATNQVFHAIQEIRFVTYKLDSAISYLAKYARQTRLPIIAKYMERMIQTILVKCQNMAWQVLFTALANATHNGRPHVFAASTAGQYSLKDYNQLLTYFKRLNRSWVGGTPVGGATRPTDIVVSPEIMEQFRAMAYQPINNVAVNNITATAATPFITLPEEERRNIFNTAGVPEFFGINVIELLELGVNQPYNALFANAIGNVTIPFVDPTNTTSNVTFNAGTNQLVLVVDNTKDYAWKAIATDGDSGSAFTLQPDNQFVQRSGKIGFYGSVQEGRLVLDTRPMAGLVV